MAYPDVANLVNVLRFNGRVGGKVKCANVISDLKPAIENIVRREVSHEPRGEVVEEAQRKYRRLRDQHVKNDLCYCHPAFQDTRFSHPVHGKGTNPRCLVAAAALELAEAMAP